MSALATTSTPMVFEVDFGDADRHPSAAEWQMLRALAFDAADTLQDGQTVQTAFRGLTVSFRMIGTFKATPAAVRTSGPSSAWVGAQV